MATRMRLLAQVGQIEVASEWRTRLTPCATRSTRAGDHQPRESADPPGLKQAPEKLPLLGSLQIIWRELAGLGED